MPKIASRLALCVFSLLGSYAAEAHFSPTTGLQPRPTGLFEQNNGQYQAAESFRARFGGMTASVLGDGSLELAPMGTSSPRLQLAHLGSQGKPQVRGESASGYKTNYFRAGGLRFTDVPNFERVVVSGLYPGVDLHYHSQGSRLEFDYELDAGVSPNVIEMSVRGANDVAVDENGDLVLATEEGPVRQRRPIAYQSKAGRRIAVDCAFRVEGNRVRLAVGNYDPSLKLVIDPVVEYASYYGGTSSDNVKGVFIGSDGSLYMVGSTASSNFPTVNAYDSTLGGTSDAFVTKINPVTGKAVFSTYVGGSNPDYGMALTVDSTGAIYFTGVPGARFPTTTGAYQTSASGSYGFVAKVAAAGNALTYSSLIAGTQPKAITVDSTGRVVVAGSAGTSFVTTTGAYQTAFGGASGSFIAGAEGDAFALMLNAAGSAAVFATFFGGVGIDTANGVAIDASGRIVIAGTTFSPNLAATGGFQSAFAGAQDGFIAMLAADGKTLVKATYLGGSDVDVINGVAVDPFGNIVVGGNTQSSNFPTVAAVLPVTSLATSYQAGPLGGPATPVYKKGFLAKFPPTLATPVFSTYTGGTIDCCDSVDSVAVDGAGDIYMAGFSRLDTFNRFSEIRSHMSNAYVRSKYDIVNYGGEANYVAAYMRSGQLIRYRSYFAGCDFSNFLDPTTCQPAYIFARGQGQVLVGASTLVSWLPITPANAQATHKNPGLTVTGYLGQLSFEPPGLSLFASNVTPTAGTSVTLTATSYVPGTSGTATFWDGSTQIGSATFVEGVATLSTTFAAGVRVLSAKWNTTTSPTVLIPVVMP